MPVGQPGRMRVHSWTGQPPGSTALARRSPVRPGCRSQIASGLVHLCRFDAGTGWRLCPAGECCLRRPRPEAQGLWGGLSEVVIPHRLRQRCSSHRGEVSPPAAQKRVPIWVAAPVALQALGCRCEESREESPVGCGLFCRVRHGSDQDCRKWTPAEDLVLSGLRPASRFDSK